MVWDMPCLWGEIIIGDFKEKFEMPILWWTATDYQKQWYEGIERIKTNAKSCLVTFVQNSLGNPMIVMWALYKKKNILVIKNHMFCGSMYKKRIGVKPFTPETCYDFIPKNLNTTGSVWTVDLDENN